ncbi:MAG: hypothetical protein EOP34_08575 [Rickettsiales bacterium]|nr:MAG: hypothetical protein EOP34_08575 [Rickettsiales bacterium]
MDTLLFLCSTSLRHSDLIKVVPATIKDNRIMLTAKKTKKHNIKVNIPLNPISTAILTKYDNDMRNCNMAYENINKYVREVLNENANLFPTLQELEAITRPSGNDDTDNTIYLKRADAIGTHSGRRTYVNICLDYNVPLNKIMGATGHTNVNTLMIYANKRKDVNKYMANTFQFNPSEKEVYQLAETVE